MISVDYPKRRWPPSQSEPNSPEKVYEIHGNLNYMRIFDSSRPSLLPMPDFDEELDPKEPLPEEVKSKLSDEAGI